MGSSDSLNMFKDGQSNYLAYTGDIHYDLDIYLLSYSWCDIPGFFRSNNCVDVDHSMRQKYMRSLKRAKRTRKSTQVFDLRATCVSFGHPLALTLVGLKFLRTFFNVWPHNASRHKLMASQVYMRQIYDFATGVRELI